MKKIMIVISVIVLIFGLGVIIVKRSAVAGYEKKTSYAIIIYGDQYMLDECYEIARTNKIDWEYRTNFKKIDNTMILSVDDAQNFAEKGLFKRVKKNGSVKPISTDEFKNMNFIYLGENSKETLTINNKEIKVNYRGNVIVGDKRWGVDDYLIVDSETYKSIKANEYGLLSIKLKRNTKQNYQVFDKYEIQLTLTNK